MKRGQVTVYIIIGILLVAIAIFASKVDLQMQPRSASREQMTQLVEECLSHVLSDALVHVGEHGGYYQYPDKMLAEPSQGLPYYFFEGEYLMPSLADIEEELGRYIDDNIGQCINRSGNPETEVILTDTGAKARLTYPMIIEQDDRAEAIDTFQAEVKGVRLMGILLAITEVQKTETDMICTSCYTQIGELYNVHLSIRADNYTSVVHAFDMKAKGGPYAFVFANKYAHHSCDDPPGDADAAFIRGCLEEQVERYSHKYPFFVGQIPGLKAEVGDNFSYKVPATGLGLTFSDSSYLFDIAIDGTINFTPTPDMVGEHQAFISVSDALGNEEYIDLAIEVTA